MLFDEWDNSSSSPPQQAGSGSGMGGSSGLGVDSYQQPHHRQQRSLAAYDSDEDTLITPQQSRTMVGGAGAGTSRYASNMSGPVGLNAGSVLSHPPLPTKGGKGSSGSGMGGGGVDSQVHSGSDLLADDAPMFELERLDWAPSKEQGALVSMAVGNGVLLIATQNCTLVRWNTDIDELEEIVISKRVDDRIHKVFIDPSGHHAIISMSNGSAYYMHSRWNKAHLLSKVKGVLIESIGWNAALGTEQSTKRILIGTNRGTIYETIIEEKDKYFKKVHELVFDDVGGGSHGSSGGSGSGSGGGSGGSGSGSSSAAGAADLQTTVPVSGLYLELFPSSADQGEANYKWFVMAATPNRLFQFIGGPTFEQLFSRYTGHVPSSYKDFPGTLTYSDLKLYSKYASRSAASGGGHAVPEQAAWLNGAGIYHGKMVFGSQDKGQDVMQNGKLLPYPHIKGGGGGGSDLLAGGSHGRPIAPLSTTLTEFHFLLLYRNRLVAINQLNEGIVFEEAFKSHTYGEMQGIATDTRKDAVWMYSDKFVFALNVLREDRHAWKLYLQEGKFDLALDYCDTDAQIERVNNAKADYLFEQGNFDAAAKIYAETGRSFEEVALKFVHISSGLPVPASTSMGPSMSPLSLGRITAEMAGAARGALKTYLLAKLNTLEPSELTQQVMICTWLTEIFLDNINRLQDQPHESAQEVLRKRAMNANANNTSKQQSSSSGYVHTTSPFPDMESTLRSGLDSDLGVASLGSRGSLGSTSSSMSDGGGGVDLAALAESRAEQREDEIREFRAFLKEFFDCLNRETTIDLLASHGRIHELLYYAEIIHDMEYVLNYHLQQGNYFAALDILQHLERPSKTANAELFYKFTPTLMHYLPKQTVDMLISLDRALEPAKLIPALMRYNHQEAGAEDGEEDDEKQQREYDDDDEDDESMDDDRKRDDSRGSDDGSDVRSPASISSPRPSRHHSIRYLEHMILRRGHRDPVLHNYLISLYAKQKDETPLERFIQTQAARGRNTFDFKYALRVCHEEGKYRSCVLLYECMHLPEEATRMALTIDLELAKRIVSRLSDADPPVDNQQRKRLWILIARHVIQNEQDISKAMEILQGCDVLLEEILPFFPDFVRIGEFKSEICKSLQQYQNKISHLKSRMEEYTNSANLIRQDIAALRNRYGIVSSNHKCDICSATLITRPFLLFPCTHTFHTQCMVEEVDAWLLKHPHIRAQVLADEEYKDPSTAESAATTGNVGGTLNPSKSSSSSSSSSSAPDSATPGPALSKEAREAKSIENYAASECILCGSIMIESVATPFISLPDEEAEVRAWEV